METLNYEVLKKSGYNGYIKESAPEKVMQFGEGNFLRAFVDYFFDCANEKADWNGKVVLVQPIAQGLTKLINDQEGLYTLYLRGSEKGEKVDLKRVISSVSIHMMISTQFLSLPRVTTLSISYPTQQKPVSYTSQKANLTSVLQSASLPN